MNKKKEKMKENKKQNLDKRGNAYRWNPGE
jgi:hypothetical protein